jgi:hypothetical protein
MAYEGVGMTVSYLGFRGALVMVGSLKPNSCSKEGHVMFSDD